jgi:hypothetical protein
MKCSRKLKLQIAVFILLAAVLAIPYLWAGIVSGPTARCVTSSSSSINGRGYVQISPPESGNLNYVCSLYGSLYKYNGSGWESQGSGYGPNLSTGSLSAGDPNACITQDNGTSLSLGNGNYKHVCWYKVNIDGSWSNDQDESLFDVP